MLLERILKLNCERCRLRTEHYIQIRDGIILFCRCLRCGQLKRNIGEENHTYPPDELKPIYVS